MKGKWIDHNPDLHNFRFTLPLDLLDWKYNLYFANFLECLITVVCFLFLFIQSFLFEVGGYFFFFRNNTSKWCHWIFFIVQKMKSFLIKSKSKWISFDSYWTYFLSTSHGLLNMLIYPLYGNPNTFIHIHWLEWTRIELLLAINIDIIVHH